jgi:hypothetical protein
MALLSAKQVFALRFVRAEFGMLMSSSQLAKKKLAVEAGKSPPLDLIFGSRAHAILDTLHPRHRVEEECLNGHCSTV